MYHRQTERPGAQKLEKGGGGADSQQLLLENVEGSELKR